MEKFKSINNFSFKKREDKNNRKVKSIQEAVAFSLLGTFEIKKDKIEKNPDKIINLSEYEKSLFNVFIQKETLPKINLFVDIDGVLIDNRKKIKELLKILLKIKEFPKNIAEFYQELKEAKIPYSSLKTLLKYQNKTANICLVTNRLGFGSTYYPFFDKKSQDIFKKHGIQVQTDVFKFFYFGRQFLKSLKKIDEQLLKIIEKEDITYYFGSGLMDKIFIRRIRQEMKKRKISQTKMIFSLIKL